MFKVVREENSYGFFLSLNFDSIYNNLDMKWCIGQINHLVTNVLGFSLNEWNWVYQNKEKRWNLILIFGETLNAWRK